VVEVDAESFAHEVEALRERFGCECRNAVSGPLLPYLVGSPKRRRVVHDRPPAQTGAGENPDRVVARGSGGVTEIAPVAPELGAVEVQIVGVAARLEYDDIQPCGGQHSGGRPAPCSRSDDADIAIELEINGDRERLDGLRRRMRNGAD